MEHEFLLRNPYEGSTVEYNPLANERMFKEKDFEKK